jgi:hypothetical protein
MSRTCGTHRAEERCTEDLVEKPGGKKPLGRCRQKANIKMFLQEVRWGMDWLRIGNRVLCIR